MTKVFLLVEGITEKILLTAFSSAAGVDFEENGVEIMPSGGKKKVLQQYSRLCKEITQPILMVFDSDGAEQAETAKNELRKIDDIYVIPNGEFEDILPDNLICQAVNTHYRLTGKISPADIKNAERKSRLMERLWREKGFGKFRKAEFASIVAGYINYDTDLSPELKEIFSKISQMLIN